MNRFWHQFLIILTILLIVIFGSYFILNNYLDHYNCPEEKSKVRWNKNTNLDTNTFIIQEEYMRTNDTFLVTISDSIKSTGYLSYHSYRIIRFKKSDSGFSIIDESPEFVFRYGIENPSLEEMNDSIYVFFQSVLMSGTGTHMIFFNLYNIEDNSWYELSYSNKYYYGDSDSLFIYDEKLANNPVLFSFLKNKAKQSQYFEYFDNDLSKPKNASKEWRKENPNIYENLKSGFSSIKIHNYSENLFQIIGGSEEAKIENEKYLVLSKFKGSVMVYDKINEVYFVLWVPETDYEWISNLIFESEDVINIAPKSDEPLLINITERAIYFHYNQ